MKKIIDFIKHVPDKFDSSVDLIWGVSLVTITAINIVAEAFINKHKDMYVDT